MHFVNMDQFSDCPEGSAFDWCGGTHGWMNIGYAAIPLCFGKGKQYRTIESYVWHAFVSVERRNTAEVWLCRKTMK